MDADRGLMGKVARGDQAAFADLERPESDHPGPFDWDEMD